MPSECIQICFQVKASVHLRIGLVLILVLVLNNLGIVILQRITSPIMHRLLFASRPLIVAMIMIDLLFKSKC